MTRGGCGEQGAKHKEEGVRTHEGYGEDKAAETEKKDYWRGRENTVQETGGGSKWTQRFWGL